MRHPSSDKRAAQFMFASPRSAKHVRTFSCVKALARMSYTRGLASLFTFICVLLPLVSRRGNAHCASGEVDFAQEVGQTDDQGHHRSREERADEPFQLDE